METLRKKYAQQDAVAGYQQLRRHTRVLATWDDHDFGRNDAGAEYEQRAASQQVFLDFFREPEDSERRKQQGVFGEWQFGEPGSVVQVILLDTRYHRSALSDLPKRKWPRGKDYLGPYQPSIDPNATIPRGISVAMASGKTPQACRSPSPRYQHPAHPERSRMGKMGQLSSRKEALLPAHPGNPSQRYRASER